MLGKLSFKLLPVCCCINLTLGIASFGYAVPLSIRVFSVNVDELPRIEEKRHIPAVFTFSAAHPYFRVGHLLASHFGMRTRQLSFTHVESDVCICATYKWTRDLLFGTIGDDWY